MRQQPLPLVPPPQPSFENYLAGDNALAVSELRAFASTLGLVAKAWAPPVYLWGAAGTGKTHLLRALQRQAQAAGLAAVWFEPGLPLPDAWQAPWRLVLLDACERLDDAAQHAAFTLFVEAAAHGVPVVAAGRLPPVDLPLRDDLKTRLGWGHVLALQPPGDTETLAVLRARAQARSLPMPDDVLHYMLTRCERDLGHLMRLLEALDALALSQGRHVTVPLLKSLLADPAFTDVLAATREGPVPGLAGGEPPALTATAATPGAIPSVAPPAAPATTSSPA